MKINLSLMIMLFIFYSKSIKENLKDLKLNFKSYIKDNFKYYVIGLLIMIISNIIISFFIEGNSTNETLIREYINIMPIYMIFSSCIYNFFSEYFFPFQYSFKWINIWFYASFVC